MSPVNTDIAAIIWIAHKFVNNLASPLIVRIKCARVTSRSLPRFERARSKWTSGMTSSNEETLRLARRKRSETHTFPLLFISLLFQRRKSSSVAIARIARATRSPRNFIIEGRFQGFPSGQPATQKGSVYYRGSG